MCERERTDRRVAMSRGEVETLRKLIANTHAERSLPAADQAHKTARRSAHFITRVEQCERELARLRGKPFTRSSHHPHPFVTGGRKRSGWSSEARPTHENSNTWNG